MSLNGLDDPKVKEAYDTAVAEPGGWYDASFPDLAPHRAPARLRTWHLDYPLPGPL